MNGNCCGFTSGVNCKRVLFTTLAVFAFIFASDFLIHGVIMKGLYAETASLWRPEAEMKCLWMILGQVIIAKVFALMFAKGYEGKGIPEGLRFGFLAGCFAIAHWSIQYAVTPVTSNIFGMWCVTGLVQFMLAGVVASLIYKKA